MQAYYFGTLDPIAMRLFCDGNIRHIQEQIVREVAHRSGRKIMDPDSAKIKAIAAAMRERYEAKDQFMLGGISPRAMDYAQKTFTDRDLYGTPCTRSEQHQVEFINKMIIGYAVDNIMQNMTSYDYYLRDISTPWQQPPLPRMTACKRDRNELHYNANRDNIMFPPPSFNR